MLGLIKGLVELWLALLITFTLHEIGHLGKPRIKRYFPIPLMYSENALSRIGGLVVNFLIIIGVFYLNPSLFFLKLIGAVSFVHLCYYLIVGSFVPEIKVPKKFWHLVVFDDVPNETWPINLFIVIILIIKFGTFYINIINLLVGGF